MANWESFNLKKQKMTKKSIRTSGLFKETLFIVIILNREFNYTCRDKNYFIFHWVIFMSSGQLIPIWTCTRKTNWWLLECRRKRKSVKFVDGFHKIYIIERNSSERKNVVRVETDKNPNDITTRSFTAWRLDKNWRSRAKKRGTRMGNRETQTRRCRKIERNLFHWSKWWRVQNAIKNARRKLETPMAAAKPCKRPFSQASIRETGVSKTGQAKTSAAKTGFSCVAEAHESTRQRIESATKRIHEEHIAAKGQNSVLHFKLVHKFIPMPQAMKIPDAKAAVDKEWKKLETYQRGGWRVSRAKRRS